MRRRVEATLAVLLILLCVGLRLAYTSNVTIQDGAVDLITIDALVPFGKLERPAVRFPHDRHAIDGNETSCLACHEASPVEDSGIVFTFKRQDGLSRDEIRDLYHSECISCHAEREAASQPTGPQVCGGCHVNGEMDRIPSSHAVDFDEPLHAIHTEDASLDCQRCHDVFGEGSAAARAINPSVPENSSHDLCVTCHLSDRKLGKESGPLNCAGCHAEPVESAGGAEPAEDIVHGGAVAFDHDLHEMADIACDTCHHKEPETSCAACHTRGGSSTGGGVSLQEAMHAKTADRSCVGCHEAMGAGETDDCSGCHAPFSGGKK